VQEEVDVRLVADDLFLLRVAELLERAGALLGVVAKLLDDLADPRIFSLGG
jgi:hypothetical protein